MHKWRSLSWQHVCVQLRDQVSVVCAYACMVFVEWVALLCTTASSGVLDMYVCVYGVRSVESPSVYESVRLRDQVSLYAHVRIYCCQVGACVAAVAFQLRC